MTFKITILGSNSAIPTIKRNPTAQLVNHNERFFLVDCAEGTQIQLRKYRIKLQRINHIFISHLHGDHFFGLVGLISSMHLLGRKKELHIYGPVRLKDVIDIQLEASDTTLAYPMIFHAVAPESNAVIYEDEKLMISTIPLKHSIPTCGFLFREKKGKRRIIKEMVDSLDIPVNDFVEIKNGSDFTDKNGIVYKNEEITNDPYPVRSYSYCSDTAYYEAVIPIIKDVDLLYYETTFMQDMADVAAAKLHATTIEAATIAKKANVKKLIIGHFSNRYDNPNELVKEARTVFEETYLADDGKVFEIEF